MNRNLKISVYVLLLFICEPNILSFGYAQSVNNEVDDGDLQEKVSVCVDTDKEAVSDSRHLGFTPPFDFPIVFSGNFGEIRANHFHGGLDFKTGGSIGKPVRALANGYISRIRVTQGSGYMLDVTYDNGYGTINRHLNGFVGEVAKRVKDLQYKNESWEVDITPNRNEYPVKQGQVIAYSGNSGYSFGPHLHLDMFETATGDFVDPLPFFVDWVKDTTAPKALGIMLFPQAGKGVVNGRQIKQAFPANTAQTINAWGLIGVGVRAYDYMNGVGNHYGVHTVVLEVDGKEVFRSVVDRFSPAENRMINSWACGQYMKSFIDPGNTLRMLRASNGNRGLIDINEERPYHFVYTLSDVKGNTSKLSFTIEGKRSEIRPVEHREKYVFHWDKVNYLQEPGLELIVPRGMLYDDIWLNYAVRMDSSAIAYTYQLNDVRIPLNGSCVLRIGLRHQPIADTTKYYIASVDARGYKYSVGGVYENGFMQTRIKELGTYTIAVDTIPPIISPVNSRLWGRTGRIVYHIKDKETGIRTYRGTIDGKYALFGIPNSTKGNVVYEIDPSRVSRGGKHIVEMTATDQCGNTSVNRTEFIW